MVLLLLGIKSFNRKFHWNPQNNKTYVFPVYDLLKEKFIDNKSKKEQKHQRWPKGLFSSA